MHEGVHHVAAPMLAAQAETHGSFLQQIMHPVEFLTSPSIIGYIIPTIAIIIFIETGLLFPLLPGDSLLFAGGMIAAQGQVNIGLLVLAVCVAAFAGDQSGYWIGRFFGRSLEQRPDSRFFKHEWLEKAHAFFEDKGSVAIILARFVPIVRTFSAVVAGISSMNYRIFAAWDVVGALLWGASVPLLGYWLGQYDFIRKNVEVFFIIIVILSIAPFFVKKIRQHRARKTAPKTTA